MLPMTTQVTSPTSPLFLGSNDDHLERAQARAARSSASIRRTHRPATANRAPYPPASGNCLGREQIIELFQNCIKLASENKINHQNTWELKLIDHLDEIIKVETEDNLETNFQKASCTLEAGVKIYSVRVDSVHTEAYKILGQINRAGGLDDQGEGLVAVDAVNGNLVNGRDDSGPKKEKAKEQKMSPLSTLGASFEDLNVKKFDVAFAVDPLYHQTSALLDEGGAKGLLLNNLGVYGHCRVVFDSTEVQKQWFSFSTQDRSGLIDLSFIGDYVEQMKNSITPAYDISPSLRDIVRRFDQNEQSLSHTFSTAHRSSGMDDAASNCDAELDSEVEACDYDEKGGINSESFSFGDSFFPGHQEGDDLCSSYSPDMDDASAEISAFLFQGLGLVRQQNAWAGPDHWKYRKPKDSDDVPILESRSGFTAQCSKNKKLADLDIYFMKSLGKSMTPIFAPPKNPKFLLLPGNGVAWGSLLPEDCHYQPEDLVKLFLLPSAMCFGKSKGCADTKSRPPDSNFDDEKSYVGQYKDGSFASDLCDPGGLVSPPRQVNKIEVHYDKTSKHVDVHMLKETLWDHIQRSLQTPELVCKDMISFKHVLATFPDDCPAAPKEDISPQLCFVSLLHLANEHNLSICGCSTLDDLSIKVDFSFGNAPVNIGIQL